MIIERNTVALLLVVACSLGLFWLIGMAIRDMPIMLSIFESSPFTPIHLALSAAIVGVLCGLALVEQTLVPAFLATIGFVAGMGTFAPYILPIIVFFVYAVSCGITVASFRVLKAIEAHQSWNASRGAQL
jgi:hypothetical protein